MSSIVPIRSKWKSAMTDRERYVAQMHFQPVDRCFHMEFSFWDECYQAWDLFREHGIDNPGDADRFFSFDESRIFFVDTWMIPGFEPKVLEERETSFITINSDGLIGEVPKDHHDTIPRFLRASIVTPDDWKRVKEEHFQRFDPQRQVDIARFQARHRPDRTYPLGIDCGSMIGRIRNILTFEGMCYALSDYPDMVEDIVETACVLVEDMLDQVLPHFTFEFASGGEDIAYKNGPMVSVDFWESVIIPRYKRINAKLKKYGIDLWHMDCDGDIHKLIPGWLDAGVNCVFPFEIIASGHPGRVLDQYGQQLRILGGVDKLRMIEGGPALKEYMESLVPYVERGGFIPFCDHRCPPNVTPANYLYYLDLKEHLFGMK